MICKALCWDVVQLHHIALLVQEVANVVVLQGGAPPAECVRAQPCSYYILLMFHLYDVHASCPLSSSLAQ